MRDRVDLLVRPPVDPAQVARAVARIDSMYEAEGYYLAHGPRRHDDVVNGQATITLPRRRRPAPRGVGNRRRRQQGAAGQARSSRAMQTKPEGFFWWQKGEFDDDKFAGDLTERIPELYARHGFIDMQVRARTRSIVDRERGQGARPSHRRRGTAVPGRRFRGRVARKRFSSDEIARFYPFGEHSEVAHRDGEGLSSRRSDNGDATYFDQERVGRRDAQGAGGVRERGLHLRAGRARSSSARMVGKDSVPTVEPSVGHRRADAGDRESHRDHGQRHHVGVLHSRPAADPSRRRVQSGPADSQLSEHREPRIFRDAAAAAGHAPANEQGDVDIIFHVKEKRTGNVNFGASVGQGIGVGGFIGFDQPNLFGACKRGSLQWQFGQYINDFNLATRIRVSASRASRGRSRRITQQSRYIIADLGRRRAPAASCSSASRFRTRRSRGSSSTTAASA